MFDHWRAVESAASKRSNGLETFLARARVFRDLRPDAITRLAQGARRIRARPRDTIFRADEPASGLYVIVQGHVALLLSAPAERERIIALRGPGELLGEDALAAQMPHVLNARAVDEVHCVYVPRLAALSEIERTPRLVQSLLRSLSHGTCALERQLGSLGLQTGLERVASYLLRQIPADRQDACEVNLNSPKWMIASMLDLTKESFSRLLRQLTEAGLIVIRGRTIQVLQPAGLASICSRDQDCARCWGCPRGGTWVA